MPDVYRNSHPQTPPAADFPAESDVRDQVSYDMGNLTGTLDLPSPDNVEDTVTFDNGVPGVLSVPLENQVLLDVTYGANGIRVGTLNPGAGGVMPSPLDVRLGTDVAETQGLLRVPSSSDVRLSIPFDSDASVGTLDLPLESDVRENIDFDRGTQTGRIHIPPVGRVQEGYPYDTPPNAKVGELTDQGTVPSPADVRESVPVGNSVGTLVVPAAENVRENIIFDNGTIGLVVVPSVDEVLLGAMVDVSSTGTRRDAAIEDVKLDVAYGPGDTFTGQYDCGLGIDPDREWIG